MTPSEFILLIFAFVIVFFLFRYFTKLFLYLADSSGIENTRWFARWQMKRTNKKYKRLYSRL